MRLSRRTTDDRRVGARGTVARSRAGREPAFDLVPDFDGPFRNRRRNHRPAHHRRRRRLGDTRNRRVLDQVSLGDRRDHPDVSCRRRARSARFQAQVEGGGGGRARELPPSVPGMRGGGPLPARMGGDAELARRRRHVDHLRGRRLCRDARVRLQRDRVRQDHSRRLLRHRPRNRRGARHDIRAVHDQDPDLPRRRRRRLRRCCHG